MSLKDTWRATPEKRDAYVKLRNDCDAAGYYRIGLPLVVVELLRMPDTPPDVCIALCRAYVAGADRNLAEQTEAHSHDQRKKLHGNAINR